MNEELLQKAIRLIRRDRDGACCLNGYSPAAAISALKDGEIGKMVIDIFLAKEEYYKNVAEEYGEMAKTLRALSS